MRFKVMKSHVGLVVEIPNEFLTKGSPGGGGGGPPGGGENLAQTLALGNQTGGQDVIFNSSDNIFMNGNDGTSFNIIFTQAAGAGLTGANVNISAQDGGSGNSVGGTLQLQSGFGAGTGKGGDVSILANGGGNGGGAVDIQAGQGLTSSGITTVRGGPQIATGVTAGAGIFAGGLHNGVAGGGTFTGGPGTFAGGDATGDNVGTTFNGGTALFRGGDATGGNGTRNGGDLTVRPGNGATAQGTGALASGAGTNRMRWNTTGIGFYTTAPIALQTGVAVTAAAIHAALVNLGLITA